MNISDVNLFSSDYALAPEDEKQWRSWAEGHIATLQAALLAAQAQVRLREVQLHSVLHTLPGSVAPAAKPDVALQNEILSNSEYHSYTPKFQPLDSPDSTLAAQHPQPILRLSVAGEVQYANLAATALVVSIAHDTACPNGQLLSLVRAALNAGVAQQQDIQLAERYYTIDAVPMPTGAALYLTDCTALRQAEADKAAQQNFYETVLHELPVEVAVFDAAHRYRFVNTRSISNPDLRAWIVGQDDFSYCEYQQRPREVAVHRRQCFEHAVQNRASSMWEETVTTAAGLRHIQRHYRPVFAADGSLHLVVGMGIDVTERRNAEKQLVDQREFYEFALDQLPCDVGIFDAQFRYLYVNASGIKDPEVRKWVIGKDNFEYFARNKRPVAMAQERHARLEQAERERSLVTYEETFFRPEGTRHQYRCLQPVFHPDGSLHLIIGYGLDVTERVVTEQALRHAKLAAESAVRAREIFLANMSHEIRTPMNAILGMSQLLAKTELAPTQRGYQQAITTSADNLLVIINDILDLSKLEAGKMVLEQVGFAPGLLVEQVEQTLRYKAAEKGLSLLVQAEPCLPAVVLGDPYRITQVLLNLASNAIKFTEKGQVVVSCEVVADEASPEKVKLLFRVTDTGVGIEPAFLERIFQEFSQEDASVTRKFGGTGLGLPICRSLVKLMGGDVQVTSEKHQGTVVQFMLHLPVGSAKDFLPRTRLLEDSTVLQSLRHKHVLLVEDNRFNRQIAKTFLQQAHVQVTEAEHGAQAVELAQEQPFDLILMDLQMPVLDGYGATTTLRQQLQLTTPIIALTANAIKGEREKCLAAGMNGYLSKPFQEAELLQVVSEWMVPHYTGVLPTTALEPAPTSKLLYKVDELLKAGQGDQSFVDFMLETFIESGEELLQDMAQALAAEDIKQLKSAAHTLKPGLAHLHVEHLLPSVTEVDQWKGDFQADILTSLVKSVTQQLREVMAQMQQQLAMTTASVAT